MCTGPLQAAASPAVEVCSLHRFFRIGSDETLALQGVTFAVQAGEVVAVVGPSGSGKSTLLTCMAGIDEPDGGFVRIAGERLSGRPERERALMRARSIGFVFQNGNLLDHLTLEANVQLVQSLTGRPPRLDVREVLRSVGLLDRARSCPSSLSGGEVARAGLAVAVANDPAVLLADEPTGELDSAAEEVVLHLLMDAADRGTAVVVASHSTAVASAADRVVRLRDGMLAP